MSIGLRSGLRQTASSPDVKTEPELFVGSGRFDEDEGING